jgi:hypothetical protein
MFWTNAITSWKSSLSGIISAVGAFVLFSAGPPYNIHYPTIVSALAGFMAVGGLVSMGINTKDNNVSGGTPTKPASKE